ncbi:TPA: hypothetical protein U5341_000924 [Yersinia enterocolitica]|nr:hypothetical protein [Yersinia enterocolitica]
MNNIEELKKAALGANLHGWTGFEDALNADGYNEAVSKFIAAANPSVVLALIAQLEAAQKERDDLREKVNQADSEWHKMADRILSAGKRAETAEAALSAANEKLSKPVVLPQGTGWASDPYNHGRNDGIQDCKVALKEAGFTVEGE